MTQLKTPLHLWIIGGLSLLWNAMGAMDYVMAKLEVAAYIEMWSAAEQAYFTSFPLWANITWAVGVWAAVLGSILLLLRHRWAVMSFALSLVAMLLNSLYGFVLAETRMQDLGNPFAVGFTLLIVVVGLLLLFYARKMQARGVLN